MVRQRSLYMHGYVHCIYTISLTICISWALIVIWFSIFKPLQRRITSHIKSKQHKQLINTTYLITDTQNQITKQP